MHRATARRAGAGVVGVDDDRGGGPKERPRQHPKPNRRDTLRRATYGGALQTNPTDSFCGVGCSKNPLGFASLWRGLSGRDRHPP